MRSGERSSFFSLDTKKFLIGLFAAFAAAFLLVSWAQAAITEQAPPIDALHENMTVGGGAILPMVRFQLVQSSGSDTLTKVGVTLNASSTITQGQVSRVSLWKEANGKPGFQVGEDTFISGAASTSPMVDGTLIVLAPTTGVSISATPSEFYVVATTSAVSSITNSNGFDLRMQVNYASTSASAGVGTAFNPGKKVTLNQSATLKISEVKIGSTNNTADEFIELYNSGEADINLADLPLQLYKFYANGSSSPVYLTYYHRVIPSHGYFLIASQIGHSGTVPADAIFATSTFSLFAADGGLSIATTSGKAATSSAIDYLGWGNQPSGNCENADTAGTVCAPALAEDGTSLERLAQGYPNATSTAADLRTGGVHATKGNGFDKNDNSADFVAQDPANPQNIKSPIEFPFGGGGSDMTKLQVSGSYPANSAIQVSIDLTFIGFGFSKPVSTTTIISATATTTVTLAASGGSNLCASVAYNPFPGNFEPQAKCNLSANLSANTSYTFTVTKDVQDLSGNQLDQDSFTAGNQNYTATFTTGGATATAKNTTPPSVVGVSPINGSLNIPTNLSVMSLEFNQANMDTTTLSSSNISLSGGLTLSSFSFSTSSGKNILTMSVGGTVAANTTHTLTVGTGVKNLDATALPFAYTSKFTTGGSADSSAPTVVGVFPTAATTIPANTNDFVFMFDDNIDTNTATSGAVTLAISGGANLPGTVRYDPVAKEGHFAPNNVLPTGQTLILTIKGGSIKNTSGVRLGTDVTRNWTVEATNSDTTACSILFANADEFSIAISFDEAVNSTDATNLSNYTLTSGGQAQTLSALAGHTLTYDATTRTAKLTGIHLTPGASFTITANNLKDTSGNQMTAASSFTGTLASASASGGFVGPGSFSGTNFGEHKDFSSAGIGFVPPVGVRPTNNFVSASTTYMFDLPIAKRIPASGTIVVTFPSSADFGLCCAATTSSNNPMVKEMNKDLNGTGPGTDAAVGIKTVTKNTTAKTVTFTLDNPTRSDAGDAHDFLKFAIADLKNPSVPKSFDSSGYLLDVKSKDASGNLLESFSVNPLFIGGGSAGGGATTTIRGTVSGNGGNLNGVTLHMMSPQTGSLDASTNSDGFYQFTNIPVNSQFLTNNFGGGGEYYLFTDPVIKPTGTTTAFFGETMPTPVSATSSSLITRDFSLTATTSAVNIDIKLTAAANTFSSDESIDIFAGGPGKFVVQTVTPGAGALSGTLLASIPMTNSNGVWSVGVGPAMPKGVSGGFGGPPTAPSWVMPKPVAVTIAGCPSSCTASIESTAATSYTFTISTADKTITGVLKDGSGNAISSAMVFAYSASGGIGNHAQTSVAGVFSIKVAAGNYVVGAFNPGMGQSREVPVVVDSSGNVYVDGSSTASTGSSGANPFTLKMTKPNYTITGQVTDGTNAVGNAPVFAYRTDSSGHTDALTDSSTGNYTLYVDNGTWKVNSFIPGFGPMTEQTVTVSGANKTDINFAPSSSATFSLFTGNIYEDSDNNNIFATSTEGITGAIIRLSGSSGVNEGVSGSNGEFSVRVPAGSGYTITDIFKPGYGRIAPLKSDGTSYGTLNLTASSTNNYIKIPVRNTVTVNFRNSNGALVTMPKAFVELFSTSTKQSVYVELTNASSTTMLVATGTIPVVKAFVQGVPSANVSIGSDNTTTTVVNSDNSVRVDGATEAVKVTINTSTAAFSQVSGTVYKTSATAGNELTDAWIQFVDESNGVHFGTTATTSGAYLTKAANGTYKVLVSKSGYIGDPTTVTVSGTTTKNFVLTAASVTITGQVTAGGSAAGSSFVRAEKVGGGQAITTTDTSGNYTLNVTSGQWRIFAAADGYTESGYSGNPVTPSASSVNIALSTTVSLQSKQATSNTFNDTSAGSLSDSTVGVKVDLDTNALGSAGNSSYLTAKETSNIPNTTSANIIGDKAKDISAFSGGSQVKNLQSGKTATVELTYTKSELTADGIDTTTEVANLKVVAYSDDKKDWESLSTTATYKDSNGDVVASPTSNLSNVSSVTFTAIGSHFSAYALSSPTGVDPPSTPSGVTATAGSAGSGQITVSWSTVSGATGYYIYRDTAQNGSFPLLVDAGNVSSYANTGISHGTYYYKVSAYKSSGSSESSASSAVSVTLEAGDSGGVGGGGGGGGGLANYNYGPSPAPTPVSKLAPGLAQAPTAPAAPSVAKPSPVAAAVSPVFNSDLVRGYRSDDVQRLQQLLAADKSIYPEGLATGFYGPATEKAVKAFQTKYGLPSVGRVGPATRVKLQEVFKQAAAPAPVSPASVTTPTSAPIGVGVPTSGVGIAQPSPVAAAVSPVFNANLIVGFRSDEVRRLQQLLSSDKELYPEGLATGYYGRLTADAVRRFQIKHRVIQDVNELGNGQLGPKTRIKLQEVYGGAAPTPSTAPVLFPAESNKVEQLEKQLKALEEELLRLQSQ